MAAWLLILLGAALGGAGFRLRGWSGFARLTGRGATTARLVCWALPMTLLAWMAGASLPDAALIGNGLYLGALAPWWRSLSLGGDPRDGPPLGQYLRHFARGLLWPLPAALLLAANMGAAAAILGWPIAAAATSPLPVAIALSGLACVPAYQIGKWTGTGTALGEILFGAAMGVAIVLGAMA